MLIHWQIDALWAWAIPSVAAADYELVLYEDGTAIRTIVVDANAVASNGGNPSPHKTMIAPLTLSTVKLYRLAVKPTTIIN